MPPARCASPSSQPLLRRSRSASSPRRRAAASFRDNSSACAVNVSCFFAISACWRSGFSCRRSSVITSCRRRRSWSRPESLRSARSFRRRCFAMPAASSMYFRRSSGLERSTSSSWPWPTTVCNARPIPDSLRSSWTSSSRTSFPLIRYSLSPERKIERLTSISDIGTGIRPASLSITSLTSAIPSAGRLGVPAKITSAICPPRSARGPCSPRAQLIASTRFDFPEPLGPTITLTPGMNSRTVLSAKDLNPRIWICRKNMRRDANSGPVLGWGGERDFLSGLDAELGLRNRRLGADVDAGHAGMRRTFPAPCEHLVNSLDRDPGTRLRDRRPVGSGPIP